MFQEKLVKYRKAKGWTQQMLAEKSGVSRSSIINWETGKRAPRTVDIERLAIVLGVSLNELLDDSTDIQLHLQSYAESEKPTKNPKNFAYWGGVLDATQEVVERGDIHEVKLIVPLLKTALSMLVSFQEDIKKKPEFYSSNVSAYNGDNSSYRDNTISVGVAVS